MDRILVMSNARLVLKADLDVDDRREFISTATNSIGSADKEVALDCSTVDAVDPAVIGMLVVVARNAHRRGARVALIGASPRLQGDLNEAKVSHFFDCRK